MGDDDLTPTDKPPMPTIGAATDAPTISVEADAAGELHETDTAGQTCGAQCGSAVLIRCNLEKGHEDPEHPAHVKHPTTGEAMHATDHVRWPVDHEAAVVAAETRRRQLLDGARELERLSRLGHE